MPCDWHIHFCSNLWSTEGGTSVAFCSILQSTKDSAIEGGGECNTPVLPPFALMYVMYIL